MSDDAQRSTAACPEPTTHSATADTPQVSTSPLIEAHTEDADSAPRSSTNSTDPPSHVPAPISAERPASLRFHELPDLDTPEGKALEQRMRNANSLAETLLLAMGVPFDEHAEETNPVHAIEAPITAAKVAAQVAEVSNALLAGTLEPERAKPVLYALQTMLTAIRVHQIELKSQRTIEPQPRAPRSARKCKRRKTASSPSRRRTKSR